MEDVICVIQKIKKIEERRMFVSQDFQIRMVGLIEQQIPDVKDDVDDTTFHGVLGFIGQYQR